jgi:DNA adenine methylase
MYLIAPRVDYMIDPLINSSSENNLRYQTTLPGLKQPVPTKPFLRWAGGKSRLVKYFKNYIPKEFGRYWELFLGSGALYFSLHPKSAYLSDSNVDLINCYRYVRDYPEAIFTYLKDHAKKNSEVYYYAIRDIYNRSKLSIAQAARFIYLNKTSFNGIFRVNLDGAYNVPYGHKEPPYLPSLDELKSISQLLKFTELESHSFVNVIHKNIKQSDFIYLDPPYPPLNGTSNFTHYTIGRFNWDDQEKVSDFAKLLTDKGCFVMISNSDHPKIRELYHGWNIVVLPVVRWIAANGTRQKVNELVISNYSFQEDCYAKT